MHDWVKIGRQSASSGRRLSRLLDRSGLAVALVLMLATYAGCYARDCKSLEPAPSAESPGSQQASFPGLIAQRGVVSLSARDRLNEKILVTSLEVQSAWARIKREIVQTRDELNRLKEVRDRNVHLITLANFATRGSLGATGSALILGGANFTGNLIQLVGSYGLSVGLSMVTFYKLRGPKEPEGSGPNMLAKVLGFPPANADEDYPPVVWAFLKLMRGPTEESRISELIDRWRREQFISGSWSDNERLCCLAGLPSKCKVTIKLLRVRLAMLEDVKAKLLELNLSLLEIFNSIAHAKSTT